MINVLVVDDEAIIREGIIKSIAWDQYNVKMVGEASNGREALTIALDVKPDIVIADIRMPVMDGLELSKQLKEIMPSVKCIILTGHGEFEYAQKAIEYKVSDFILKPIGAEELVEVVLRLKQEILLEKKQAEDIASHEMLLQENIPVIQGRLINKLISASYTFSEKDEILNSAQLLNMDLSGPKYQVFIIAIDNYFFRVGNQSPEKREIIFDAILNIARETLSTYTRGFICRNEMGLFACLINTDSYHFGTAKMCKQIQHLISKHLKLSISIGIGNECKDLFCVCESYKEALHALRNRIYRGKNVVIHINDIAKDRSSDTGIGLQSFIEEEKELLVYIKLIDVEKINDLLNRLFDRLIAIKADYNSIKNIALNFILVAFRGVEEMGICIEERVEIQFDPFREIERYETIEDLKAWVKNVIEKLMAIIDGEKNEKYKSIVKFGLEYIVKHFDEPLTLTVLANTVHVTPNYFSRIFREETGERFLECLNKYRIEKAKELLSDISLKTYEVAEKVGFNDYKHFSYNFKKYVGCNPSEYKP